MADIYYAIDTSVISSDPENRPCYEISIDDINRLALFATTLKPLPEVTEAFGYAAALEDYCSKNSDEYSVIYRRLVASTHGSAFLSTSIQLVLIEKEMRNTGMDNRKLQAYGKAIENYQRYLRINQSMYEEYENKEHSLNH